VFVRLQSRRLDLARLVAEELGPTFELPGLHHQLAGAGRGGAPRSPRLPNGHDEVHVPPETVEQGALTLRGEEALVLMLAVDLRDPAAEGGERADGHSPIVDPR